MRWLWLVVLLIERVVSAQACVEVWNYWSDHTRHEVNLDSGAVKSREMPEMPTGYQGEDSPDGRYNARMEPRQRGGARYRLLLTDRERGLSITLAEGVSGLEWSPDGTWLAYMQSREDRSLGGLALYNLQTGERITGSLPENKWDMLGIDWSPDGRFVAATFIVDSVFLGSEVQLFSVPDLTLVKKFTTRVSSAKMLWSPDGRSITVYGINDVFAMADVESRRIFHVGLDGAGYYEASWSPGGSYLLVRHSFGDLAEMMDILSARGEILVQNRTITASEWVNDQQVMARVWTDSGMDDLTLFDLERGTQHVFQPRLNLYELSPDSRYVAAKDSLEPQTIRVFDVATREVIYDIAMSDTVNSLIWREDASALVALFDDRSLREYDLEGGAWRTIATVPGREWMLRRVGCGTT